MWLTLKSMSGPLGVKYGTGAFPPLGSFFSFM